MCQSVWSGRENMSWYENGIKKGYFANDGVDPKEFCGNLSHADRGMSHSLVQSSLNSM